MNSENQRRLFFNRNDSLLLVGVILACSILYSVIDYWHLVDAGGASLGGAIGYDDIVEEVVFKKQIKISWEGRVFGVLSGGECLAVRRSLDGQNFLACSSSGEVESFSGLISISGLWLGTQCGWRNTVFGGRCVPSVLIDNVASVK